MPLVTPTSTAGTSQLDDWTNKLVGKTIHDEESNETVRLSHPITALTLTELTWSGQAFCKRNLPQPSRIVKPGMMVTRDFKEDRLNVHVNDDGIVSHVTYG
ncbi:Peptidase inhibitor I78 family [Geosmithia morbida]|uniref:Peptidase inhibitor I78 family n=1 Tax=Geosmithia morbida TaxID=1094350 RepID=A0A9P4YSH6_9HYPO|nr:Peptidase inhibitor I78 family [Geosmithia morbida]KAF4122303.1 Peptidase inhibitor I78 family [Geosmithia morbida]